MLDAERIFLENGDHLIFEDEPHLRAFLEYVFSAHSPWVPPARNNGRTTAHRERYCLRYFLAQEAAKFKYPIAVEKTERPDFVITDNTGRRIGVEHTDAGSEAYQRWLAQTEQDQADNGAGASVPDAAPGDHSLEQVVADIVATVSHKTGSINKSGYQDVDEYVLIVYVLSNAPLFFSGDIEDILARLPDMAYVNGENGRAADKTFDRALVIVNGRARYWR